MPYFVATFMDSSAFCGDIFGELFCVSFVGDIALGLQLILSMQILFKETFVS
jgi:hypothetical protein